MLHLTRTLPAMPCSSRHAATKFTTAVAGIIISVLISACVSPAPTKIKVAATEQGAECVMHAAMPWLVSNWGQPYEEAPSIEIVSQDVLQAVGHADSARNRDMVYGLSFGNSVWLWEGLDLSHWSGQEIMVHELAHWIDHQLVRQADHRSVYALADKWTRETGGVEC